MRPAGCEKLSDRLWSYRGRLIHSEERQIGARGDRRRQVYYFIVVGDDIIRRTRLESICRAIDDLENRRPPG